MENVKEKKYWQGIALLLFGMWEQALIPFNLQEFQIFWNNIVDGIVVLILELSIASEKQFMPWFTTFNGVTPSSLKNFESFLEISKFYDLVIIGFQSNFGIDNKKLSKNCLQKLLEMESTLIFVVPEVFKPIKNIFIAYDTSVSATRALHHFAHIAALSNYNIRVFMTSEDSKFAEECVTKAKDYLSSCGAKNIQVEWTKREIAGLLEFPYVNEFDAIALGLHSKKRILDFFVGSVTKLLLETKDKALLIGI